MSDQSESKFMQRDKFHLPAPKWTPTQRGPSYMISAEELEPAPVPGQRVIGEVRDDRHHRRVVEVSTTHLPYELWIDTAGNILQLPIKTTRCLNKKGQPADDSAHAEQQRNLHWSAGWLRFDTGAYGEDREHWLARRDAEIAERRGFQAEDMKAAEDRFDAEKQKEEFAKEMAASAESLGDGAADRARRAAKRAKLDTGEI